VQTVAAGPAGGRPPLLYRRGDAGVLHLPMLRPPVPDDFPGSAASESVSREADSEKERS
jgi:hypothetical protein